MNTETVVIAIGSNLGDRIAAIRKTGVFLQALSEKPVQKASVWESEPVGAAKYTFLNTAARIETSLPPSGLLAKLKAFERACGREQNPVRWGPRIIDLDIICYGNLVIEQENLIIPHPEYSRRLFVLLPMKEILPEWQDPGSGKTIEENTRAAPDMIIRKTEQKW